MICQQCTFDGEFKLVKGISGRTFSWCPQCSNEVEVLPKPTPPDAEKPALACQEGSNHYKDLKIQPVEYIERNGIGFCAGSAIKYLTRYKAKNGLEDLKKARHFIDLLIELEYGPEAK